MYILLYYNVRIKTSHCRYARIVVFFVDLRIIFLDRAPNLCARTTDRVHEHVHIHANQNVFVIRTLTGCLELLRAVCVQCYLTRGDNPVRTRVIFFRKVAPLTGLKNVTSKKKMSWNRAIYKQTRTGPRRYRWPLPPPTQMPHESSVIRHIFFSRIGTHVRIFAPTSYVTFDSRSTINEFSFE